MSKEKKEGREEKSKAHLLSLYKSVDLAQCGLLECSFRDELWMFKGGTTMTGLSLLGIVVGIGLFIYLAFQKFNMLLSALLASIVIAAFSGMNVLTAVNELWMGSVAGFLQGFFLIFVFSSLFGQTLSDGKASRSIAVFFAKLVRKSKKNQKLLATLFIPIMYGLLSFAGISGFVIIFTVLTMSRDLFQEFDIPWRLYCYGGASTIGTVILGGSLQLSNIILDQKLGTGLAAGMLLSIVGALVFYAVTVLLIVLDLKKAERTGEGFMKSGAAFKNEEIGEGGEEDLPPVMLSLLPILVIIAIAVLFNQVLIAIVVGILLNLVLFNKYIESPSATINNGIVSGFTPVINVAATIGISAIIGASPGFGLVQQSIEKLPAMYGGIILIALLSFLTASPTAALPTFGPIVAERMMASGMSAGVAHRMIAASVFPCIGPHSPGVINASVLAKIEYKDAVVIYLKATVVPGLAAVIVMALTVQLGIFK